MTVFIPMASKSSSTATKYRRVLCIKELVNRGLKKDTAIKIDKLLYQHKKCYFDLFGYCLSLLLEKSKLKAFLTYLKDVDSLTFWTQPLFEEYRKKQHDLFSQSINKIQIKEGHYTCFKCHKRNCSFFMAQTRSGDEGMTTFITCHSCGAKWKD